MNRGSSDDMCSHGLYAGTLAHSSSHHWSLPSVMGTLFPVLRNTKTCSTRGQDFRAASTTGSYQRKSQRQMVTHSAWSRCSFHHVDPHYANQSCSVTPHRLDSLGCDHNLAFTIIYPIPQTLCTETSKHGGMYCSDPGTSQKCSSSLPCHR
jgi:hypothetical protein